MVRRCGASRRNQLTFAGAVSRSAASAVSSASARSAGSGGFTLSSIGGPGPVGALLLLLEAVAHAVERFNAVELGVDRVELLAQPLDVAVDGAVVDIDLVVIGRIHQRVAALHDAGALGERLQDQEFRDRQRHRLAVPGAGVAVGVHRRACRAR